MHVPPCHVTHLVYRLGTGGMENVVVQLIRNLPRTSFRHTVIALSDIDPEFARRLDGTDVELIALNKPPGQPYALYPKVYRLLRRLRPDVLHSCNLGALEFVPVAALARVPLRVHVEHGLDLHEINGKSARYRLLRRLYRPFVSQYVAVSVDQARQCAQVGAAAERVHLIPNGVDTRVFRPRTGDDALPVGFPFQRERHWVIGTVGPRARPLGRGAGRPLPRPARLRSCLLGRRGGAGGSRRSVGDVFTDALERPPRRHDALRGRRVTLGEASARGGAHRPTAPRGPQVTLLGGDRAMLPRELPRRDDPLHLAWPHMDDRDTTARASPELLAAPLVQAGRGRLLGEHLPVL